MPASEEPLAGATSGSLTTPKPHKRESRCKGCGKVEPTADRVEPQTAESIRTQEKQGRTLNANSQDRLRVKAASSESWKNSSPELKLSETKRMCERCGINEVFLDIKTMTFCSDCIMRFVLED